MSIYNTIEDFLIAKSHWESIPLKVTNEGLFEMIDGKWEKINKYEDKPTYERPPRINLDTNNIPSTTICYKKPK